MNRRESWSRYVAELANCYLEEDKPGDKALDAYQDALKADNVNL